MKALLGNGSRRSKTRFSPESLHCATGHVVTEHQRLRERIPDSPRVRPTLPHVSLLTDSEPPHAIDLERLACDCGQQLNEFDTRTDDEGAPVFVCPNCQNTAPIEGSRVHCCRAPDVF
jgi:hypothetical protein